MNQILRESVDFVRTELGEALETITVERAVLGLFFSGVKLSTGHGGMCFTPVKMMPQAVCCPSSAALMPSPGKLRGRKASLYLDDIERGSILKKTLGIATLNALAMLLYERGHIPFDLTYDADAFDSVDVTDFSSVAVVGALVPVMKRLLKHGVPFTVLEQDPRTLKGRELDHFRPAEAFREVLPHADLVFITGTTVINDTIDELLAVIPPEARVIVAGPTVSMIGGPYFSRGVNVLGGDWVDRADEMLDRLSEGGSGYHLFGKSCRRTVMTP